MVHPFYNGSIINMGWYFTPIFFYIKCTYNQPAYSFGSAATFLKEGRYDKLRDERKKECDLMLLYNDDLWKAHYFKEWSYCICGENSYASLRAEFWDWIGSDMLK